LEVRVQEGERGKEKDSSSQQENSSTRVAPATDEGKKRCIECRRKKRPSSPKGKSISAKRGEKGEVYVIHRRAIVGQRKEKGGKKRLSNRSGSSAAVDRGKGGGRKIFSPGGFAAQGGEGEGKNDSATTAGGNRSRSIPRWRKRKAHSVLREGGKLPKGKTSLGEGGKEETFAQSSAEGGKSHKKKGEESPHYLENIALVHVEGGKKKKRVKGA